ncbi:hypothetical protein S245_044323, partial [Arachis hypogaea]
AQRCPLSPDPPHARVSPRLLRSSSLASGLAPSASYSSRPPSLHPTPGVLHCSRLASLPAAVLPGECSRLAAPPSLPRLSSAGVAACTALHCSILQLQQQSRQFKVAILLHINKQASLKLRHYLKISTVH